MVNVNELYAFLEGTIPSELSCDWDNDGRMCVPDGNKPVKKVLICLDITASAVDYAVEKGFDCIISHHPLVFNPIKRLDCDSPVGKKLCRLVKNDIAAFSFHTRLDKVSGGVNDAIADVLELKNVEDFSDVGRMGEIAPMSVCDFGKMLKDRIRADRVLCVDGGRTVKKIAIVGGSGKGYLEEAFACGCDTFVTGEMPYNCEQDARELGINLICGGHYFTEDVICERIKKLLKNFDSDIVTEKYDSNVAFVI